MAEAGFTDPEWLQTVNRPLTDTRDIEPATPGIGRGAFLVLRAKAR